MKRQHIAVVLNIVISCGALFLAAAYAITEKWHEATFFLLLFGIDVIVDEVRQLRERP